MLVVVVFVVVAAATVLPLGPLVLGLVNFNAVRAVVRTATVAPVGAGGSRGRRRQRCLNGGVAILVAAGPTRRTGRGRGRG